MWAVWIVFHLEWWRGIYLVVIQLYQFKVDIKLIWHSTRRYRGSIFYISCFFWIMNWLRRVEIHQFTQSNLLTIIKANECTHRLFALMAKWGGADTVCAKWISICIRINLIQFNYVCIQWSECVSACVFFCALAIIFAGACCIITTIVFFK